MCGIVGAYWYSGGVADPVLLEHQVRTLQHRGPDDVGVWSEGPIALGHRRLSIRDLSPAGRQPLQSEDHSVRVICNGEIYNWLEIRTQLAERGHCFRSHSDSEILPHLWEEQGPAMLGELRGMFALGLYDLRKRTLMLARDRAGKKPLFYHDNGRRLVFASELKSLMLDPSIPRDVDFSSMADMLTFQYVPSPRSIWSGVRKLPAGCRLVCDARGPRVERFWTLPVEVDYAIEEQAALERLQALLAESVRIRLGSDVPVGAFLSGGLDSSAVVALMAQASSARIHTFSLGFEGDDSGELEHARRLLSCCRRWCGGWMSHSPTRR
jgi:asparagine synthase (glutamine-hydrolysing)